MPAPSRNSDGPIWSKQRRGPTICRWADGSARRTAKLPRSRARGTITVSIRSAAWASPGFGSGQGCQLICDLLSRIPQRRRRVSIGQAPSWPPIYWRSVCPAPAPEGRGCTSPVAAPENRVPTASALIEPCLRDGHVSLREAMPSRQDPVIDNSSSALEDRCQTSRVLSRDDGVGCAREDEDGLAVQIRRREVLQGHHGAQENGASKDLGSKLEHGGGDVGPVRETHGDRSVEPVHLTSLQDELGKRVRAAAHVLFVEDTFCETPEEAWHAPFEHLAAGREQRGARRDRLPKEQKVVLVPARAVQKQDRWLASEGRRHKPMAVRKFDGGRHGTSSEPCDGPVGLQETGPSRAFSSREGSAMGAMPRGRAGRPRSPCCGSYCAGSLRDWPKDATGSSTAKPGMSVAISNST